MNNIINLLLRASISASLSDREAFIDRVSQIIEDKIGKDPDAARQMSDNIASAMEGLNEQLVIEQLLHPKHDEELNKKIDRLTDAVEKLTGVVDHLVSQNSPLNQKEK